MVIKLKENQRVKYFRTLSLEELKKQREMYINLRDKKQKGIDEEIDWSMWRHYDKIIDKINELFEKYRKEVYNKKLNKVREYVGKKLDMSSGLSIIYESFFRIWMNSIQRILNTNENNFNQTLMKIREEEQKVKDIELLRWVHYYHLNSKITDKDSGWIFLKQKIKLCNLGIIERAKELDLKLDFYNIIRMGRIHLKTLILVALMKNLKKRF